MKCWICLTMERPWWISRNNIIKLSPDGELALGKESLCIISVCWCPRTRPLQNCVKRDCWTQTEPEVVDQWHVWLGCSPGSVDNYPHTPVSLILGVCQIGNRQLRTGSGEMEGVADNTLRVVGRQRGVLCSRVASDLFPFWSIRVKVDICKLWCSICRVARDPQLGKRFRNRRASRRRRPVVPCSAS